MLDAAVASLYRVTTKALNQQVKRHSKRFPSDFMFKLTRAETRALEAPNLGRGQHRKYLPFAFTELGVGMVGSLFRRKAGNVSIEVLRAFARRRAASAGPTVDDLAANSVLQTALDLIVMNDKEVQFTAPTTITYFVQAGAEGLIKIGSTRNLPARLRSLQLMSPIELHLLGAIPEDIERRCHYELGPWRVHGEWFLPTPRVLQFICQVATVKSARLG